ncbi:S8 family serine peptidase [Corallococcus macrosporus]|uniref:S8 family serine peptidase n=1 Tax=Corallococcus macrosporus TaxID=35 RepID=A0ABS3DLG4_9BACT|nr:S8 family serine peptidase [Corallococcus macrosporus]
MRQRNLPGTTCTRTLALALGLLTASLAEAAPSALKERAPASKLQSALVGDVVVERLVVKFHEGTRVRLRGGRFVVLAEERESVERARMVRRGLTDVRLGADLTAALAVLERVPRIGAPGRLFTDAESVLNERKRTGEERGGQQLADLNLYFEVPLLPGTSAGSVAQLVKELNAMDSIEVAYAEPRPVPAMVDFGLSDTVRSLLTAADLPPVTPMYESLQGYLNAAPSGIDARYAWTVPGGNGSGVRIVDVENGWRTTHEDMPNLFTQIGTLYPDSAHGTAVLGVIVGVANGYGVTGIAHGATAGVASAWGQHSASSIASAAAAVGRGGVVLIELQYPGPVIRATCGCNGSDCNFVPLEWLQSNYDAIATATANGVTVVEAAGNGGVSLDEAGFGNAFNRNVRDSGAILVGASTANTREPMCWTNYGSRVDVHGWGQNVTTLGGDGRLFDYGFVYDEDQHYTSTFSGTSSAAPIVTGAVASLQGISISSGRGFIEPRTMRRILAETGTPQAASSKAIGPLPDLRQAINRLLNGNYNSIACTGQTPRGATNWQPYDAGGAGTMYLDVNTSGCGFLSTPRYFASIGGDSNHWSVSGASAIYFPTATGFRVYVSQGGINPSLANQLGYHLNWQALPNGLRLPSLCAGQTPPGATNWQPYGTGTMYLDVNTSYCGFSSTPRYTTSIGGDTDHWSLNGASAIYFPTATGFRVYVSQSGITPALANQRRYHLNWQATPPGVYQPYLCTAQTPPGATNWQPYGTGSMYLDVNTSFCGFLSTPRYITSIGGDTDHWSLNGASAIYFPTATGFRVYVYQAGITPALANQRRYHLNWGAR